ncbi:SIR2 family protein [Pseudoduganella albidiflava]|uniref:SIR2 family protein n=1 Tax=Pseudoduganella albidiflava TaxID=321983 RepID=UPI001E5BE6F5|nr:SIR2 family protein [Pseudoduganella albidiflava]
MNQPDYDRFEEDHKYLSAKLLTYFIEHPLLFIGYRAEDPNIKAILYDVDRMVRAEFQFVPNIYILEWNDKIDEKSYPARDKVISVAQDVNIRIKSISASSFEWVFKAFGQAGNLERLTRSCCELSWRGLLSWYAQTFQRSTSRLILNNSNTLLSQERPSPSCLASPRFPTRLK